MRKTLILFLVMLLVIPVVLAAQPPFTQESAENVGLSIVVPKVEYIELNQDFAFHIHLYGTLGILLTNETADCNIHIYNTTGHHIIGEDMYFDTNLVDFQYIIAEEFLTTKKLLPFVVWCNSTYNYTTVGGHFSGSFEVKDVTGVGITEDTTHSISITLFLVLSTLIFFFLPKIYGTFTDNQLVNLIIIRCCYVLGFYFMVMNAGFFMSVATSAGYGTGEVFRYLWIFGNGGYILMVVTAIKTIFDLTKLWDQIVKQKRGLE